MINLLASLLGTAIGVALGLSVLAVIYRLYNGEWPW
jgi:hypothetical protein